MEIFAPLLVPVIKGVWDKLSGGDSSEQPQEAQPAVAKAGVSDIVGKAVAKARENLAVGLYDEAAKNPDAINKMNDSQFDQMLHDAPIDTREDFEKLMKNTTDPERKLRLWAEHHKAHSAKELGGAMAKIDWTKPDAAQQLQRLNEANVGESREADEEMKFLLAEKAKGKDINDSIDKLAERKKIELDIEKSYGVNLTNDTEDDNDPDFDAKRKKLQAEGTDEAKAKLALMGDHDGRERRVWSADEMRDFKKELDKIPEEHRHGVKEFRRASKDFDSDQNARDGVMAQAYWGDAKIEVLDGGAKNMAKGGGVLVHEIGHTVDRNHKEAQEHYKKAVDWHDYGSSSDLETQLTAGGKLTPAQAKAKITELLGKDAKGGYGQQSIEVDGVMYQVAGKDNDGNPVFSSYNANAIPRVGEAEVSAGGAWRDEFDYGRTNTADLFADHYKLAARDPVRLHSDMRDAPEQKVKDAEKALRIAELQHKPAAEIDAAKAAIKAAETQRDTLKQQFDIMRKEVYGVTDQLVAEKLAGVPADKVEAFKAQAESCSTPAQLEKLQESYKNGTQVDADSIGAKTKQLPKAQQDAFAADAARCFSADQLQKLYDAYHDGHRAGGKWIGADKLKDPDVMLGN